MKSVKLEIYDQTYQIRGELDEAYVSELGRYVDAKMREVAASSRTIDSLRVAVLAAINIADELHTLRTRQVELTGSIRKRVERSLALVDRALD